MGTHTTIEWCDHTFNPWRGCSHAKLPGGSDHPGCAHCYAEAMSRRNPAVLGRWGGGGTRVVASKEQWKAVTRWNKRAAERGVRELVFCASLGDIFEAWDGPVLNAAGDRQYDDRRGGWSAEYGDKYGRRLCLTLDDVRRRLFRLIDHTPHLDWLLLTKRPENVRLMIPDYTYHACVTGDCPHETQADCEAVASDRKYRENVWIGTSISDQPTADVLLPELLKLRDLAPVLFVSAEPLLGPVDLGGIGRNVDGWPAINALTGERRADRGPATRDENGPRLDWVIVGGESGPHARPMHPQWARDIRDQCCASGVPFFFKQCGEWRPPTDGEEYDTTLGRQGKPPAFLVSRDGNVHCFYPAGTTPEALYQAMLRVGKAKAGRLLDGREWNQFPKSVTKGCEAPVRI